MARPRGARQRAERVVELLRREYPEAVCELDHSSPYELLVAAILSAQCTDERVNMVTPEVFARYPEPDDLAVADLIELEGLIRSTGFFRSKAKSLTGMARGLVERFDGEMPTELDDLVSLPGVGRKTGNVIRSVAFGLPGLPVDTHVGRLSRRLKLTGEEDPVKVERDLGGIIELEEWGEFSLRLILHGRRVCVARAPRCDDCVLVELCPSAGQFHRPSSSKARSAKAS